MFLEVKNLCKNYGKKEVLKDINFSLDEGLSAFVAPLQEKLAQEQQKYQQKKTEY